MTKRFSKYLDSRMMPSGSNFLHLSKKITSGLLLASRLDQVLRYFFLNMIALHLEYVAYITTILLTSFVSGIVLRT